MGINDRKQEVSDNRRAKQKAARSRRRSSVGEADYGVRDAVPVVAAIIVAASAGGALRLGVTRDGGGYAVGCYAGDEYATEYIKPSEDWDDAWREIVEAWWPTSLSEYDGIVEHMRGGNVPPFPKRA